MYYIFNRVAMYISYSYFFPWESWCTCVDCLLPPCILCALIGSGVIIIMEPQSLLCMHANNNKYLCVLSIAKYTTIFCVCRFKWLLYLYACV